MKLRIGSLMLVVTLGACADEATSPAAPPSLAQEQGAPAGLLPRYVSMGTSVSMGWQSDGLVASTQIDSWPAQLARLAGNVLEQPYISAPGCRAPFAAPLASGRRTSGEPILLPPAQYICAPLVPGFDLPTMNVAISGALTVDALNMTPELHPDPFSTRLYSRVLRTGQTQLTAALSQRPTYISVEFGSNEVLGARSGVAIPGVSIFPIALWKSAYSTLVGSVAGAVPRGVLVGLINDGGSFPSFRRGGELAADRASFLGAFHVDVNTDCDNSPNLVFVPVKVLSAVADGLGRRAGGLPPFPFSCADGGLGVVDYVLDPAELAIVNATLAAMNAYIRRTADKAHFALFYLEELYGRADLKPPFSVVQLMTSSTPYGPYMSLDGVHPNAQGHAVLAAAAARALNTRYGIGIPVAPTSAFIAAR
jgi:hypothetical protein